MEDFKMKKTLIKILKNQEIKKIILHYIIKVIQMKIKRIMI